MSVGDYVENFGGRLFAQSLFEESSVQKHRIGTLRMLDDGRAFAYAKSGAALLSGELNQGAVPDSLASGVACALAVAVADKAKSISIVYGAGAVATKDYFKDGYLVCTTATLGIGHMFKIRNHAAMTNGATVVVHLYDTVNVALTLTTSKFILIKNPQDGVIQAVAANPTAVNTGVNPIAITSGYYFWNQVKGACAVTTAGSVIVGNTVGASATAGAVMPLAAGTNSIDVRPVLGQVLAVGANTGSSIIMLAIPGY